MTTTKSKDELKSAPKSTVEAIPAEFQKEIAKAKAAKERMRTAKSKITAQGLRKDPRKMLREQHVPESFATMKNIVHQGRKVSVVSKPADWDVCFTLSDSQTRKRKIYEGWEPVIYEGEQVSDGADLMWKREVEYGIPEREAFEAESRARLAPASAKAAGREAGVDVEEVSIERGVDVND